MNSKCLRIVAVVAYTGLGSGCTDTFYSCPPGEHIEEFRFSPAYSGDGCLIGSDGCPVSDAIIRVTWVTDKETIGPYHHPTDENGCFNSNWGYLSASFHFCSAQVTNEAEFGATLEGEFLVGRLRAVIITVGDDENAVFTTLSFNDSDIPDYAPWKFNYVDFGTITIDGVNTCVEADPQP